MPHYPSPGQCQARGKDLNYAKFKCIIYWAKVTQIHLLDKKSLKSQPSPHLKDEDL